jgi:hypothetical protein
MGIQMNNVFVSHFDIPTQGNIFLGIVFLVLGTFFQIPLLMMAALGFEFRGSHLLGRHSAT